MRTKDEIKNELISIPGLQDSEAIKQVYATCTLAEVMVDIRDILRSEISGIARSLYVISKQP